MAITGNERLYEDGVNPNTEGQTQNIEDQAVEANAPVVESGEEPVVEKVTAPEVVVPEKIVPEAVVDEEVVDEEKTVDEKETTEYDDMSDFFDEEDGFSSGEFDDISLESKAITEAQLAEAESFEIPQSAFLAVDSDADKAFEEAQGFVSQLTRAVAGGAYKGTMTLIENTGYVVDVAQWFGFSNSFEEGYTNMVSEWASERKAKYDEYNGIYGDSAMAQTMQGLQGLIDSTVGFAGIGAGAGAAVKGGVGLLNQMFKAGKLIEKAVAQLGTAAITNYAESVMMGAEMHEEIMNAAKANDISYAEAVRRADGEVRDFMLMNKVNIFSDAIALNGILKGQGTITGGMKKTHGKVVLDQIKQGFGEAFEEVSSSMFQKDETRDALIALNIQEKDNSTYLGRSIDYATSKEGLTDAAMGFIGGPFQHYTVKAFTGGITKAREKLGLIDPVVNPGEFTKERPKKEDIIKNVSQPVGPAPVDPVTKYMNANKGVSKADAEKAVSKEDWDAYRKEENDYKSTSVTDEDYEASKKEYEKQKDAWKAERIQHKAKVADYVNYIENRKLGTNMKAKEDLDKFFQEEGDLMMAYKQAVLDEDATAMEDIENQRFEGLFARYANRGMIDGLENHLKEVEAGGGDYTTEQSEKATKFLAKLDTYSSDYMKMYNKHGRDKANNLFKLQSRIGGLKDAMVNIDKDLDVDRNNVIKEIKTVTGRDVSPLQLELMATKAEMQALNEMRAKLSVNPEMKIGLQKQIEEKELEIEKKIGKLSDEIKTAKGDGSQPNMFGKAIADAEIESLDSYKKFVETAGKKMNAWVGYQGLSKTFEFENSAESKKLLRKKYHEYLSDQIENNTFTERELYTNMAMIGKVDLSKKQQKDLVEKLNVVNKEITDEALEVKDQVMRAEKRINALKTMKKDLEQKGSKLWGDWKKKNEYDFKPQRDKVAKTGQQYSDTTKALDDFQNKNKIGKYEYKKDRSFDVQTLQEKQQANIKYSPTEYKNLLAAQAEAEKNYKKEKAAMVEAIVERAQEKTEYRQKKNKIEEQQKKVVKQYNEAVETLKAIDVLESNDKFKYRVDKYLETLIDGNIDAEFEIEKEDTEVVKPNEETPTGTNAQNPTGPTGTTNPTGPTSTKTQGPTGVPTGGPTEVPTGSKKLTPGELVEEVNENGLGQTEDGSVESVIDKLAKQAGVTLEPVENKEGPKDGAEENQVVVTDLSGTTNNSEAGTVTPTGTTNMESEVMIAVTEVITTNLDPSGKAASELATAAAAQLSASGKKNDDVAVTDVKDPDLTPPITEAHNEKQGGSNPDYGWSLAYVSDSDGVGDSNDSGLADWLESQISDKRGVKFRFEVAKKDGDQSWSNKATVDKFLKDPSSLTQAEMDELPIRMVAYDSAGNKIKVLGKEVYGWFKLPFNLNVAGQNEEVRKARTAIIEALSAGATYETEIESVSTGKLKSIDGTRKDPRLYFDAPKSNGEGKLLVSNGIGLVKNTDENLEDTELVDAKRDFVGGLAGFVFIKTRSLDGKPFPLKLNSRKLNPNEIQSVMEVLAAYANGETPSDDFTGKSDISGIRNKDIIDLLIYTGQASLDKEYPFYINLNDKPSSLTFGKDKTKINFSELQNPETQKKVAESLATMWRTTDAKNLNKTMRDTNVGNGTFTWFGEEIKPTSSYNDFQFSQGALSTNAEFPSNRLFVQPTVILKSPSKWTPIGFKKEKSSTSSLPGTTAAETDKQKKLREKEEEVKAANDKIKPSEVNNVSEGEMTDQVKLGDLNQVLKKKLPKNKMISIKQGGKKNLITVSFPSAGKTVSFDNYKNALEYTLKLFQDTIAEINANPNKKDDTVTIDKEIEYVQVIEKPLTDGQYLNKLVESFGKGFDIKIRKGKDGSWYLNINGRQQTFKGKDATQSAISSVIANREKFKIKGKLPSRVSKTNVQKTNNKIRVKVPYITNPEAELKDQVSEDYIIDGTQIFNSKGKEVPKGGRIYNKVFANYRIATGDAVVVEYTVIDKNKNEKKEKFVVNRNNVIMTMAASTSGKIVYTEESSKRNKIKDLASTAFKIASKKTEKAPVKNIVKKTEPKDINEFTENKGPAINKKKSVFPSSVPENKTPSDGAIDKMDKVTSLTPKIATGEETNTGKGKAEVKKKIRTKPKAATLSKIEQETKDNAENKDVFSGTSKTENAENLVRQMIKGKMITDFTPAEQALIDTVPIERKIEIEKEIKNNPGAVNSIFSKRKTEADIAQEIENIRKILPNVPVEVAKTFIEGAFGGLAEGQFYKGVVTIANGANEGIAYHEGFHAVMDGYLTLRERNNLLKKVQNKYGVNPAQAEEILAEEFREYMLSKRTKDIPNSLRWIYDLLMDLVDAFRSNKGKIFSKIRKGRFDYIPPFAHSERIINDRLKGGLKLEVLHEAIDHIAYRVIKMTGVRSMDLSVQEGFNDLDVIFDVIRKDIINDQLIAYDKGEVTDDWDEFDQLELIVNPQNKKADNWEDIVQLVKDELQRFSLLETEAITDKTDINETNEYDGVSGGLNIKPALTYSGKDNATHNTRFMVKMLSDPNASSKYFGGNFKKLAKYEVSWRLLEDSLANIVEDTSQDQVDKMLNKIKDLAQTHPEFNELIQQLEAPEDVFPTFKKIQFYRAFSKQKVIYNHSGYNIEGDEYNVKIGNADQQSHAKLLESQFIENFNNKFIENGEFKSDTGTKRSAREELTEVVNIFKSIAEELLNPETFNKIENAERFDFSYYVTISNALNTLGIEVSPSSLQSYVMGSQIKEETSPNVWENVTNAAEANKFKKQFLNSIIYPFARGGGKNPKTGLPIGYAKNNSSLSLEKMLSKDYDFEKEEGKNFIEDHSLFKLLASIEGYNKKETLENMVLGPENNLYWTKSLNNFISKSVNQWKQDPQTLVNLLSSSAYHQSSKWAKYLLGDDYDFDSTDVQELDESGKKRLEEFAVQVYLSNRIENDSTDQGTAFKNMTSVDMQIDSMNKVLNGVRFKNGSVFSPLTLADKSSHFMFTGLPMEQYRINNGPGSLIQLDKDGSPNSKAVEDMYLYFIGEINRYSNAHESSGNNKSGNKYFDNVGSKKLTWFPELSPNTPLANEIGLFDKDGLVNISDKEVVKKVKLHIKETIESQHEKAIQSLKDNNIIKENTEGGKTIIGIDSTIKTHYENNNTNESSAVDALVLDYIVNAMTANIEFTMLFTGDPAFYKDLSKRTPATSGQGTDLIFMRGKDGKYLTPKKYSLLVIKDADTETSEQYDEYREHLRSHKAVRNNKDVRAYTEEQIDAILKPYSKTKLNKGDGQGFISPQRYKSLMIGLGKWDSAADEAFERLMDKDGNPDPRDLLSMQPLKGMHFELRNENGFAIPTYLKYSQAVLWPALVKGTQHEALLERMMDENNPIDEVVYESGVKSGAGTVYSKEQILNGKYKTTTLSNYHWKLQQDLPTKYEAKGEALVGSQPRKNIFQNMFEKDAKGNYKRTYRLNGEVLTADQMAEKINTIESKLSNIGKKKFDNKYGVVNGRITNQEPVYEHLIEKFKNDGVDMNVIEQLEARVPLSLIFQHSDKIEQEIFAELKKATIKLTSAGGSFVQIAGEGFAQVSSYKKLPVHNKNGIRHLVDADNGNLKGPRIREDGSLSAQVYLPFKDIENIPGWEKMNDKQLKEALGDTIKNIVGYRIPNQKISGMDSLEIVGILPPAAGDSIVVYDEVTGKTGSDFDIDKMYVMMYNTVFNPKAGRLERINKQNSGLKVNPKNKKKYGALKRTQMILENERLEMWASVLESKDTFTDAILPVDTAWLKNEAYYLHLLDYISKDNEAASDESENFVDNLVGESLGYKKNRDEFIKWFKNSEFSENIQLIDREGNDLDSRTILELFVTSPKETRDEAAAQFFSERPGNSLEFASPFTQNEIRERNLGGKAGVGITANHLTHHNLLQAVKMAEVYGTDGQSISETLSAYMNAYVDNAKDPFISLINNNLNTANTVFYMIRNGIPASVVNRILSLPEIKDYVKNIESQNSKLVAKERKTHLKIVGLSQNGSLQTTLVKEGVISPMSKTFEKYFNGVSKAELEKLSITDPSTYTEEDFDQMILSGKSDPGLLLYFMSMEKMGRDFNKMVTASKYDTDGPGSGMADWVAKQNLEKQVLDGPFADEYMAILDGTFVGAMKTNASDDVQTLMSNLFSSAKKPMIELITKVSEAIGTNSSYKQLDGTDVEFNKRIIKTYQSYAFSNGLNIDSKKTNEMFFGKRSMAKRLIALRNTAKYSSNPFLQSFSTMGVSKEGADFITFPSSKKRDPREKDKLWTEWESLYDNEETREFAKDLIKYAYASSGFQKNINSFYDLIPNTILQKAMEKGILPFNNEMQNTMADGVNFDNFFDQFIAHNPDMLPSHNLSDPRFIPLPDNRNVKNKTKAGFSVKSKSIPFSFYADQSTSQLRKFITLSPKGGKPYIDVDPVTGYKHKTYKLLYEHIGEKGGQQYYKRVPILGMSEKGNHIVEYKYDTKIEKSAVSPFENTLMPGFEDSITSVDTKTNSYILNEDSPIFRDGNEPVLKDIEEVAEEIVETTSNINTPAFEGNISQEMFGENDVMVFGANSAGGHGQGVAALAYANTTKNYRNWNPNLVDDIQNKKTGDFAIAGETGLSVGNKGTGYGLVTKNASVQNGKLKMGQPLDYVALGEKIEELYNTAKENPNKRFIIPYNSDVNLNKSNLNQLANAFGGAGSIPPNVFFGDNMLAEIKRVKGTEVFETTEQTPAETTMSKLDGLQEVSKQSSLATVPKSNIDSTLSNAESGMSNQDASEILALKEAQESLFPGPDDVESEEQYDRYVKKAKESEEYKDLQKEIDSYYSNENKKDEESVYKLGDKVLERQSNYVSRKLGKETESKPSMKAGASVGNFVDNIGRDIFDGGKVKTLKEYVKEADAQNKENGFTLSNISQEQFDILVDHLTGIKNSFPDMNFVSKELFLNANFTAEQIKAQGKDGIGGTLDLLGVDSDGKLHIIDFKNKIFNKDKQQFWDKNLYDDGKFESKLTGWSRQLSIYKEMLEQKGFEVATTSILLIPTEYSYGSDNIFDESEGGTIKFDKFHSPNSVGKPIPEIHQSSLSPELIDVPQNKEMVEQFRNDTEADVAEAKVDETKPKGEDLPKPPSIEEIKEEDDTVVQVFRIETIDGFRVEVRKEVVEGETVYQAYAVEDTLVKGVDPVIAADFKEGRSLLPKAASTQEEAVALAKSKISRFDIQGLLLSLNNAC